MDGHLGSSCCGWEARLDNCMVSAAGQAGGYRAGGSMGNGFWSDIGCDRQPLGGRLEAATAQYLEASCYKFGGQLFGYTLGNFIDYFCLGRRF